MFDMFSSMLLHTTDYMSWSLLELC